MRGGGYGLGILRAIFTSLSQGTTDPTTSFDVTAGYYVGQRYINTVTGNEFTCTDNTAGAAVWRHVLRVLAMVGVAQTAITGDTNEHISATVVIAANLMGASGIIETTSLWTITNSSNNKTLRTRFGASGAGTGGTAFQANIYTTSGVAQDLRLIRNRGLTNSQVGVAGGLSGGLGAAGATVTSAIDTTAATEVCFSGQLASSGESITLEAYSVRLLRP